MKIILTILGCLSSFIVTAQSLLILPNSSSPVLSSSTLKGFKHSNSLSNAALEMNTLNNTAKINTTTNSSLAFTVNDGQSLITLNTMGYLGLGNSAPTERLDLKNGRIRFTGQKNASSPSGLEFTTVNNMPAYRLEMKNDDIMRIFSTTNSIDLFQMNVNNGRVGINTAPQTEALTVAGYVFNSQFINSNNQKNVLLAKTDGTLVFSPDTKYIVTPWQITRLGQYNNDIFTISNNFGYFSSSNLGELSAPLHFPNAAKLKTFSFKVIDNSALNYIKINIIAQNVLTGNLVYLSSANSKALATSAAAQILNGYFFHTVDPENYIYYYSIAVFKASDDQSVSWSSALKVGNVVFEYQY